MGGLNWKEQNDLCRNLVGAKGGRLFTPESLNEVNAVESSMIPKGTSDEWGYYYTDYVLFKTEEPEMTQHVYLSYTHPTCVMPSELWAYGEPNGIGFDGKGIMGCVNGYFNGHYMADTTCTPKFKSVICEFPSEN